jgi:hypothetical protein
MRLIVRRQLGTAPPSGRTLKLPGHEFPVFIPHNPIDLSLRFDDSQLEYGARWYDDFAKAATNLRERPEPYPDVVYYLGKPEGYVDLMNQLGLSIHDAENKADALRYILSIPRASSIDEFFRKANAVDISDFLHERPQYMSSWNAIREMGEAESAKQGGKPQEMRPPEQLIGAPG